MHDVRWLYFSSSIKISQRSLFASFRLSTTDDGLFIRETRYISTSKIANNTYAHIIRAVSIMVWI